MYKDYFFLNELKIPSTFDYLGSIMTVCFQCVSGLFGPVFSSTELKKLKRIFIFTFEEKVNEIKNET